MRESTISSAENIPLNEPTQQWMKITNAIVRRVPRLGSYAHPHTIRVGIVATSPAIERFAPRWISSLAIASLCQNLMAADLWRGNHGGVRPGGEQVGRCSACRPHAWSSSPIRSSRLAMT